MTRLAAARAWLADDRGAVAIEFAAIAVPLMVLLAGSMETSRYVWTRHALQDAASTGARCVGLRTAPCAQDGTMDATATVAFVQAQAAEWAISIPEDAVTPVATAACHDGNAFAKVAIRHSFTSVIGVLPQTWIEVEACFPVMSSP